MGWSGSELDTIGIFPLFSFVTCPLMENIRWPVEMENFFWKISESDVILSRYVGDPFFWYLGRYLFYSSIFFDEKLIARIYEWMKKNSEPRVRILTIENVYVIPWSELIISRVSSFLLTLPIALRGISGRIFHCDGTIYRGNFSLVHFLSAKTVFFSSSITVTIATTWEKE